MTSQLAQILFFIFFFFAITAFSLLINSILLRFVKTLGTKNQPGAAVRWSTETKPAIGGLSLFIVFFISFSVYSVAFDARNVFESQRIIGLLAAGTIGFLMGLTDDAYNTRPLLKFLVQVICGLVLVSTGSGIVFFGSFLPDSVLTVVWVVGMMNSINMLDNMDGIAATVSAFITLAALGALALGDNLHLVDFTLLLGVLGALLGFLFFNWNPSSMYMGDTGSQFLGVILAYIGIHYCWNAESMVDGGGSWLAIAALVSVFLLPLTDTIVVTVNRLRRGQSPFVGGKDHTTHHLSYLGLNDVQVGYFYVVISIFAVSAYLVLIQFTSSGNYLVIGLYIAGFLMFLISFFLLTARNQKR